MPIVVYCMYVFVVHETYCIAFAVFVLFMIIVIVLKLRCRMFIEVLSFQSFSVVMHVVPVFKWDHFHCR